MVQSSYEIKELLYIYFQLQPRYVLEIGVHRGGTLKLWMDVAPADACIIAIDVKDKDIVHMMDKYKKSTQDTRFINGDSKRNEVRDSVTDVLDGNQLDFVFVDGGHTYNAVSSDYNTYFPLIRDGGIMAFHDLRNDGVWKLWSGICEEHPCREIYDPNSGGGIGVIYKGLEDSIAY